MEGHISNTSENSRIMARPALIFLTITLVALQSSVLADSPEADAETIYAPEEDPTDRGASASAHASAHAVAQGTNVGPRPYPVPIVNPLPQTLMKCYACSDCPSMKNNTIFKACPYSSDLRKNGKCVVYSQKYFQWDNTEHMKEPWVIRGCASERGTCSEIRAALEPQRELVKLLSCVECEGDRCNGVGHSSPDLLAALAAVFITPLLLKYTLS